LEIAASICLIGYDNANRISGITDSSNGTLSWTYGYDALDRLTSATTNSITDGWTYDANGNRMTQTGTNPITFSVNSGNNQLSSTSGSLVRSYSYDAAGNAQAYGSYAFGYNNRGRMMATNAGSTNYLYNALGQMIEKSGTAGTTIFMQDESGHLIGEYDGSGNLIEETIWLGDIPVATLQFGTSALKTYYVHTDHLNTPRRITNRNTNIIVWRWDSDPFGNGAAVQNPQGSVSVSYNLRFPGQYYMAETGLNQNYARDYDPAVGRYVEPDPIGLDGGIDPYRYVADNPVSLIDPLGLVDPHRYAPKPTMPDNGNILPGFTKQDQVCSFPFGFYNSYPCLKQCCVAHDDCYTRNGCNASSWIPYAYGWPFPQRQCEKCNEAVVDCIKANADMKYNPPCHTCIPSKSP
jgi:RHS repeat-associated protein